MPMSSLPQRKKGGVKSTTLGGPRNEYWTAYGQGPPGWGSGSGGLLGTPPSSGYLFLVPVFMCFSEWQLYVRYIEGAYGVPLRVGALHSCLGPSRVIPRALPQRFYRPTPTGTPGAGLSITGMHAQRPCGPAERMHVTWHALTYTCKGAIQVVQSFIKHITELRYHAVIWHHGMG